MMQNMLDDYWIIYKQSPVKQGYIVVDKSSDIPKLT